MKKKKPAKKKLPNEQELEKKAKGEARKILHEMVDHTLDHAERFHCPTEYWIFIIGNLYGGLEALEDEALKEPCNHTETQDTE